MIVGTSRRFATRISRIQSSPKRSAFPGLGAPTAFSLAPFVNVPKAAYLRPSYLDLSFPRSLFSFSREFSLQSLLSSEREI